MKPKRGSGNNGVILDTKFRIMPLDDMNIVLEELIDYEHTDKETKEISKRQKWERHGYYHSVPNAIKSYCRLKQNRSKNLNELLSTMEELNNKIDDLFEMECACQNH